MRILLDEGVPDVIQKRLNRLSIFTVEEMGWRGVKNGALLDLMAGEFQVIVTTDKNLPFQQNLLEAGNLRGHSSHKSNSRDHSIAAEDRVSSSSY